MRRAIHRRLVAAALFALVAGAQACGGSEARCDPTLSWSTGLPPADAGHLVDAGSFPTACVSPGACRVVDVAAGAAHTCVRGAAGDTICFGDDAWGQSDPRTQAIEVPPTRVTDATRPAISDGQFFTRSMSLGAAHTCVVASGVLRCWGAPEVLGAGRSDRIVPLPVQQAGRELAGGGLVTYVWTSQLVGDLVVSHLLAIGAWDGFDPAHTPQSTPVELDATAIEQVRAAGVRSCLRDAHGVVQCREPASAPRLSAADPAPDPESVPGLLPVDRGALATGPRHACAASAITASASELRCWGEGARGQLGNGASTTSATAVHVSFPDGATVSSFCVGGDGTLSTELGALVTTPEAGHACAIVTRGSVGGVMCWGANDHGQLGDGTTTDRAVPTTVVGLTRPRQLACGGMHTCVIDLDDVLWCWGDNTRGQLGVPSAVVDQRLRPVRVDVFPGS
jgi:hypothetical protein